LGSRTGRLEEAEGGTLFLDEIGDFSPAVQVKLLRFLQEREYERVGSNKTTRADVRVIAATNKDLEEAVKQSTFRNDLYYRINVFPIFLPPLRERHSDILLLADHFVARYAGKLGKEVRRISTPAINMMFAYHWPGNVRELENCIEYAMLLSSDGAIHGHHLPPTLQMPEASEAMPAGSLTARVQLLEKDLIVDALKSTDGNLAAAARLLGITSRMIRYKIKNLGIDYQQFFGEPAPATPRAAPLETLREVDTPKQTTCEDVAALLAIPLTRTVKLIAVMANSSTGEQMVVLLLRGDHMLNEVKLGKLDGMADFRLANEAEIRAAFDCPPGFLGPVGIDRNRIKVIADHTVAAMSDFVCGANKPKLHLAGVNFGRDLQEPDAVADIRNVMPGDPSPDGKGSLQLCRGIEVGHVFQLGSKYSQAMNATYLDEAGKAQAMEMGCYGIGVSRIVASAIEQHHDEKGIIWPPTMAPFLLVIVAIGYGKSELVKTTADTFYDELTAAGFDVLLDDRDERPGVMFADAELIGIPHRVTIGERGLKDGMIEYQPRRPEAGQSGEAHKIALADATKFLKGLLEI